jgi:hypothetical protein
LLAIAYREVRADEPFDDEETTERGLTLLGLIGPPDSDDRGDGNNAGTRV